MNRTWRPWREGTGQTGEPGALREASWDKQKFRGQR